MLQYKVEWDKTRSANSTTEDCDMYRISRFHQTMKALPRGTFDRVVQTHQADQHSKGFGCWDPLLAMVYAQLSGASSLRGLETGFNNQHTQHYHLATSPLRLVGKLTSRCGLDVANRSRTVKYHASLAY